MKELMIEALEELLDECGKGMAKRFKKEDEQPESAVTMVVAEPETEEKDIELKSEEENELMEFLSKMAKS